MISLRNTTGKRNLLVRLDLFPKRKNIEVRILYQLIKVNRRTLIIVINMK